MKSVSNLETPRTPIERPPLGTRAGVSPPADRIERHRAGRPERSASSPVCAPADQRGSGSPPVFVAAAPATLQVRELASKVAGLETSVMIVGESGVGKNALARFIHHLSGHDPKAYLKIHCSTADAEQLEAEIFGDGRSEREPALAREGTLLLDDIGGIGPRLQARLLRAIEERCFLPAEGREPLRLRARILTTCDRQLEREVAAGNFRRDLYWRLRPLRLAIPPLRERRPDIPKLCQHFLETAQDRSAGVEIPERLMDAFMRYDWPGNVRELAQSVARFVILPDTEAALAELEQQPISSRRLPVTDPPFSERQRANGDLLESRSNDGRAFGSSHSGDGVAGNDREPFGQRHPLDRPMAITPSTGGGATPVNEPRERRGRELELARDEKGRVQLKLIAARAAEEAEKQVVLDILEKVHWNRKRAAARMDICYKTLLNKLERWELNS